MSKLTKTGKCKMCGYCCKNLCVEIEAEPIPYPKTNYTRLKYIKKLKQEEIKNFEKKDYTEIEPGHARWNCNSVKVDFVLTCSHLKKNNRCDLINGKNRYTPHDRRPPYCKKYPTYGVPFVKTCGYKFIKK